MKIDPHIDYNQRPATYWDDAAGLRRLLRNVKGTERRKMIKLRWEQGRLDEIPPELLGQALSEAERQRLGRIHPALMGGEYLPDCFPDEAEIARIELESTTSDVISIRARRDPAGIRYRIVDEYGSEFVLQRQTSRRPLTLRQLVEFLEGSAHPDLPGGLALGYNLMNAEVCGREELRHFTSISSEFYPDLATHYERVFEDWIEAGKLRRTAVHPEADQSHQGQGMEDVNKAG